MDKNLFSANEMRKTQDVYLYSLTINNFNSNLLTFLNKLQLIVTSKYPEYNNDYSAKYSAMKFLFSFKKDSMDVIFVKIYNNLNERTYMQSLILSKLTFGNDEYSITKKLFKTSSEIKFNEDDYYDFNLSFQELDNLVSELKIKEKQFYKGSDNKEHKIDRITLHFRSDNYSSYALSLAYQDKNNNNKVINKMIDADLQLKYDDYDIKGFPDGIYFPFEINFTVIQRLFQCSDSDEESISLIPFKTHLSLQLINDNSIKSHLLPKEPNENMNDYFMILDDIKEVETLKLRINPKMFEYLKKNLAKDKIVSRILTKKTENLKEKTKQLEFYFITNIAEINGGKKISKKLVDNFELCSKMEFTYIDLLEITTINK